jgi:peptidoglycan hydrolase-like protein with peptidoglycan-binding domain
MAFRLEHDHVRDLFRAANFDPPEDEMVLFALRGCVPVDVTGTAFAAAHQVEFVRVDYRHMNCTFAQWLPNRGEFALFPGSTVPHVTAIRRGISKGGKTVNQLALGFFTGEHRYYKGDHKLMVQMGRHRALRNDSSLPVWRTGDDEDYEGDDAFDYDVIYDNIHCAYQMNVAEPRYSSDGCQVIAGRPQITARGWDRELGPWAKFVENAYGRSQKRFSYALFAGHEALKVAENGSTDRHQTVRFGSAGQLVRAVQGALIGQGFDLGPAGVTGVCDIRTVRAIRRFQQERFGAGGVDVIVGSGTARELGVDWPRFGAEPAESVASAAMVVVEREAGATSPDPAATGLLHTAAVVRPNYRSLAPDGFFSADPYDLSVRRSIRTNNPGALNISSWQRSFPGYVGQTQPDRSGNKTAIYVTPEHGTAAWYHLLTDRYQYGRDGSLTPLALAKRYAGVNSDESDAVKSYLRGWLKWSSGKIRGTHPVSLADRDEVRSLAWAMFSHEIGGPSPLSSAQIDIALDRYLSNDLPKD